MAGITLPAYHPLCRGGHVTSHVLSDRGDLWLGDSCDDLPVVMGVTSNMRRYSSHRDGGDEQDCELGRGEHDERRSEGGKERERRGRGRGGRRKETRMSSQSGFEGIK